MNPQTKGIYTPRAYTSRGACLAIHVTAASFKFSYAGAAFLVVLLAAAGVAACCCCCATRPTPAR